MWIQSGFRILTVVSIAIQFTSVRVSAQTAPCATGDQACVQIQALRAVTTHSLPQFRLGAGWVLQSGIPSLQLAPGISVAVSDTPIGHLEALSVDFFVTEGAPAQIRFQLAESRAAFWCRESRTPGQSSAHTIRPPIVGPFGFRCDPGMGHALTLTLLRGLITPTGNRVLVRWAELGGVLDILRHGLSQADLTQRLWATAAIGAESSLGQDRSQIRGRLALHARVRLPAQQLQFGADFWVRPLIWSNQRSAETDSSVTAGIRAEISRYWRVQDWGVRMGVEAQGQWGRSEFMALDHPTGNAAASMYMGGLFRLQRAFTDY